MSSDPNPTERPFGRVAILGLGLMGGSLARALTALRERPRVVGWAESAPDTDGALAAGAIDLAASRLEEATSDADLVVVAMPLGASLHALAAVAGSAPADATVTDVVSLKAPLERAAADAGLGSRWVGSHPMVGGEGAGFRAAREDLYRGGRVWTVAGAASPERVAAVAAFWRTLGAEPEPTDALEHDRLMALASHLPQLTSNALARVLIDSGVGVDRLGPGGRDMTRLAASSPSMWRDLLAAAPPELADSLRALSAEAGRLAEKIESGNVEAVAATMEETMRWSAGS